MKYLARSVHQPSKKNRVTRIDLLQVGLFVTIMILIQFIFFGLSFSHAHGAPVQQGITDTHTPSPTATNTQTSSTTITGTVTLTPDLTITATPSTTQTTIINSSTPSVTPTFGVAITLSPTATFFSATTADVTETQVTRTPTSTYLPLPAVTMIYPKITATQQLMLAYRSASDVPKQRLPFIFTLLLRFWPLGLIFSVWGILGLWLIFIQHKMD